jgi:type VI secretion system protein ImpE
MAASVTLRDGTLAETLSALQARVRGEPAVATHRIVLFELLSVLGQWDRALNQLEIAGQLDRDALAMVQTYREALSCEALRAEVFAGRRSPLVLGQPEQWVALLVEALRLEADGRDAEARELRAGALEAAEATAGRAHLGAAPPAEGERATGTEPEAQSFTWIADADPRLGPLLEAIVNGRYYWIPFRHIRMLAIEKPADLRDLVWAPARFLWANGGEAVGLVPTRYPGTERSDDDAIRLARRTEWVERPGSAVTGLGQRMLATDAGEYAILDLRRLELEAPAPVPDAPPHG